MPVSEYGPTVYESDGQRIGRDANVPGADVGVISAPLEWYPRLHRASPAQRANWRLIGEGHGIHWPDVDEDISTIMLIEGLPSVEYTRAKTG